MKKFLLAILLMSSCAMVAQDSFDITPGVAKCIYDHREQYYGEGWYKMVIKLLPAWTNPFPQTQIVLYSSDTMAIAKPDTRLMKAYFVYDPVNIFEVDVDSFSLEFVEYDVQYAIPYPHYRIYLSGALMEPDHTPFRMTYDFLMAFYNYEETREYSPSGEGDGPQGFSYAKLEAPRARKIMRDGQLLIIVGDDVYDLYGRRVE